METIREARTIVKISEDKLRDPNAERYPLRKRLLIDRVMEKADKNTPSSDSYYIMCDLEDFIREMEAILKKRRSKVDLHQEKKKQSNGNRKENLMTKTTCRKRKRPDSMTSRRMRRRRNLGM